jgi:hypothetical protein
MDITWGLRPEFIEDWEKRKEKQRLEASWEHLAACHSHLIQVYELYKQSFKEEKTKMNTRNKRLEMAELLILTESPEFKEVVRQLALINAQYRSDEHSFDYMAKYTIDIYDDGSGAIYNGKDYLSESLTDFPE